MKKLTLLLIIGLAFICGCADVVLTKCNCPSRDMVLRSFNSSGERMWLYLREGDLNEGVNDGMKLTPEEAQEEQERFREPELNKRKYSI